MKKRIQMNALFIILQVNKILFTLYRSPSSTQMKVSLTPSYDLHNR